MTYRALRWNPACRCGIVLASLICIATPAVGIDHTGGKLTVSPAKPTPTSEFHLLPLPTELTDGNAAEFYLKAVRMVGDDDEKINPWDFLHAPLDKLPKKKVRKLLDKAKWLALIDKGARCRECNWDKIRPDDKGGWQLMGSSLITDDMPRVYKKTSFDKSKLRWMVRILELRVRLAVAEKTESLWCAGNGRDRGGGDPRRQIYGANDMVAGIGDVKHPRSFIEQQPRWIAELCTCCGAVHKAGSAVARKDRDGPGVFIGGVDDGYDVQQVRR